MPLILLAGYTGSGKTEMLEYFQLKGQQVLNLEQAASHNGSVFGHIPYNGSPTSYSFHKILLNRFHKFDLSKAVFCEAKSPAIGQLQIPSWLFQLMQQAPVVWLNTCEEIRLQRLLFTYGNMDSLSFIEALSKLSRVISKDLLETIYANFEAGKKDAAFAYLMEYYDNAMYYSKERYNIIGEINITKCDAEMISQQIMAIVKNALALQK